MTEIRLTHKKDSQDIEFFLSTAPDGHFYLRSFNNSETIELSNETPTGLLHFKNETNYSLFQEDKKEIDELLLELQAEYLDEQFEGYESNLDFEEGILKTVYSPEQVIVENKQFSIGTVMDMVIDKDIEIAPSFQRRFIWDRKRKSRLIESILLGLPLPSIYFSQYSDGRLTVVDGLQRINTIIDFWEGRLELCDLEYLSQLNGLNIDGVRKNLSPLMLRRFKQTQLTCIVIDYRSPQQLKYDLFQRLNTGGKPLNKQEIRNCLSRPLLQNALLKMVNSQAFIQATGGGINDTRMGAQESALKFMYFKDIYKGDINNLYTYKGSLDNALNEYVDKMNCCRDFSEYINSYERCMKSAFSLFGKYTFRKITPDYQQKMRSPINKALMLAICVLLDYHYAEYAKKIHGEKKLTEELCDLLENKPLLFNSITWSTTSPNSIITTFNVLKKELFDKNLR